MDLVNVKPDNMCRVRHATPIEMKSTVTDAGLRLRSHLVLLMPSRLLAFHDEAVM